MAKDQRMGTPTEQPRLSARTRDVIPQNHFGLMGIDHYGLPCRDPDVAGRFIEEILGGIEVRRFGYSEEDRRLGRLRHIFYHIGGQMLEVVENEDPTAYPRHDSDTTNPHWAWRVSAQGMARFVEHLKDQGVPYNGPRSHGSSELISLYFRDIDGNNLELCTYDPVPEGLFECVPVGGKHGLIKWSGLAHNWRPRTV